MAESTEPIQSILIGAGNRGAEVYGQFALMHPWFFRFTAIADPNPVRRANFSRQHGISEEKSVDSWQKLLEFVRPSDLVFICSPDRFHYEQVLAFMEATLRAQQCPFFSGHLRRTSCLLHKKCSSVCSFKKYVHRNRGMHMI